MQGIEFVEERAAFEEQQGAPKNAPGRWASCLRIVDPTSLQTSRCGAKSCPDRRHVVLVAWLCLLVFRCMPGECTEGCAFMTGRHVLLLLHGATSFAQRS